MLAPLRHGWQRRRHNVLLALDFYLKSLQGAAPIWTMRKGLLLDIHGCSRQQRRRRQLLQVFLHMRLMQRPNQRR